MQEENGKYIFGVVKVGDKGQIVIPRDARKVYDIKPGDTLMVYTDGVPEANIIDQAMEGLTK